MGYGFLMHVDYCLDDISEVLDGLAHSEMVHLVEIIKECSSIYVFECKINLIMGLEVSKKAHNVRMVKARVQTNLIGELIQHFKLGYFSLCYLLHCNEKT